MDNKTAVFNEELTIFAQASFANPEVAVDLSALFFPTVGVDTAEGSYLDWRNALAFAAVDTSLTRDNSARRIELVKTKAFYDCKPNALEIARWRADLLQAKAAPELTEKSLKTLMSVQFVSRNVSALEIVRSAVPAASGFGAWRGNTATAAAADPIAEIEALCAQVSMTGKTPNKIVMGRSVWSTIRNHPKVLARVPGISVSVNEQQLLDTLSYKGLDIIIVDEMALVDGQMAELMKNDLVVFYNSTAPDTEDLSMGKEFSLTPDGPKVIEYTEHGMNEVTALLWSGDRKVTNTSAVARLTVTTPTES